MTSAFQPGQGFVVVTHGYPQQDARNVILSPTGTVSPPSSPLGKFLKGQPAALGAIEIMIGMVVLLFGIVSLFYSVPPSVISGVTFWGAIIYIIAGSLTVEANKHLSPCLIKASLGMNIISTLTAVTAISMYSLDMALYWFPTLPCHDSYPYDCHIAQGIYWSRVYGIAGVMIVFSVLEFIVSICVSAFACNATCSSGTGTIIYQAPPPLSTSHLSTSPVNNSEHVLHGLPPSHPTSLLRAPSVITSEMPRFQNSAFPRAQHSHVTGMKADAPNLLPMYA